MLWCSPVCLALGDGFGYDPPPHLRENSWSPNGIMMGSRWTIGLVVMCLSLAGGCASPPWSPHNATPEHPAAVPAQTAPVQTAPVPPTPPPPTPAAAATPAQPGSLTPQQVMAEVQNLGATDPAAQAKLLAELQQADPNLWPLVVQNFRARMAYAGQLRQAESSGAAPMVAVTAAGTMPGSQTPLPSPAPSSGPTSPHVANTPSAPTARIARLPVSNDTALPPAATSPTDNPPTPASEPAESLRPIDQHGAAAKRSSGVVQASYSQKTEAAKKKETGKESSGDWREPLTEAITQLQSQVVAQPKSDAEVAEHARLRLLQLAAGQRDAALEPIPAATGSTGDFWSKEVFGLNALLDTEKIAQQQRRSAEAKRHLVDAMNSLGESASLDVRNLAFCREVQSYGAIKRFDKYEFTAGQRLLLYAEVENFKSEDTPKGYHTSLRSSYQIFDAGGRRVDQQESTSTEEYCTNPRRDYFIGCDFHLPKQIYPGQHTLKLTVEDLKSHKVGESSIEFTIK
jgi:hypothetical protein